MNNNNKKTSNCKLLYGMDYLQPTRWCQHFPWKDRIPDKHCRHLNACTETSIHPHSSSNFLEGERKAQTSFSMSQFSKRHQVAF